MVYNKYIGIIGGTGTIGSIIVKYLLQLQTHFHVLIGGRRSIKEISMSTFYNSERLKYNQMNYNNDVELDNFCSQCLLVINAVGPSFKINDKIALHALRNNCHYIDIGGYGILRDLLKPYEKSIEAQKLCFIIGVGWMPGISGVFSKTIIETHLNSTKKYYLISIMVLLIIGHIVQLMIWQHHLWEKHVPMFILMERKYRCLLFDIHITNFFLSLDIKKYVCHHLTNN